MLNCTRLHLRQTATDQPMALGYGWRRPLCLALLWLAQCCGAPPALAQGAAQALASAQPLAHSQLPLPAPPPVPVLLVLGDSLSAEYGLTRGSGWVALLQARLQAQHRQIGIYNASISGETTAGGHARLAALLRSQHPRWVIIELGANDALRGLSLDAMQRELQQMVSASQQSGAKVLLLGQLMPPNFGRGFNADFAGRYLQVAKDTHCALLPFFLKGVADRPDYADWFQSDGLHPLARAHPIILDNVWSVLAPLLPPP